MAAPISPVSVERMSKFDRRLLKKHSRFRRNFAQRKDINLSDIPTQHLLVNNGGLGNNARREQLLSVFEPYGRVTNLVMEPDQPYAFVSYSSVTEASAALAARHGRPVEELQTVPSTPTVTLYLSYVDKVPHVVVPTGALPEGLVMIRDFVSEDDEQVLLQCVDWDSEDSQISEGARLTMKHRRVKHYGYEFMYGVNNVDPERPLEQGIPRECDQLLDKVVALGCLKRRPDQLTVNRYLPGQGIPTHVDTHSAFEDGIVSLSLGSQAIMDFKGPTGDHFPIVLPRRSLVIMLGPSRYLYTHGIMPRKSDVVTVQSELGDATTQRLTLSRRDTRTSFTFRVLRRGPCQCRYPDQCDSQRPDDSRVHVPAENRTDIPLQTDVDAARLEEKHVHNVYEEIAGHFSDTRHTPWPRVVDFLKQLPPGALVADVGCGNGKYLAINPNICTVGFDRSSQLVSICGERGLEACVTDVLALPLKSDACDAVICIAVIHHFSTPERRLKAIEELVRVLGGGGTALISVWAFEQERNKLKSNYLRDSKTKLPTTSSGGSVGIHCKCSGAEGPCGCHQSCKDAEARNVTKLSSQSETSYTQVGSVGATESTNATCRAHIVSSSKTDDSSELASSTGSPNRDGAAACTKDADNPDEPVAEHINDGEIPAANRSGTKDRDALTTPLVVHVNRTNFQSQDLLVPWHLRQQGKKKHAEKDNPKVKADDAVYHRYYHVFVERELEGLCRSLPNVRVMESYYDKGNWCVIIQKH